MYLKKHLYTCDEDATIVDNESKLTPSPLIEYYEAFRSLRRAIEHIEPRVIDGDLTLPQVQYYQVVSCFTGDIDDRGGAPEYDSQHIERLDYSISDYRNEYGNGDWITDFQCISTVSVESEIENADSYHGYPEYPVVPVSPSEGIPAPVQVTTRSDLKQALSILAQFPAEPAVTTEENTPSNRFPVMEAYSEIISDKDIDPKESVTLSERLNSTVSRFTYENTVRRFALVHIGDASVSPDTIVVAFGIEFPSGAVVVEWLDNQATGIETTQNGLAIKPGPDGLSDLRNVDLQDDYAELVFID
jgi:hypothetical protein